MMAVDIGPTSRPVSLVGAAAYLGMSTSSLRHALIAAGHPAQVGPDGRGYLTIGVDEVAAILDHRRELAEELASLPGWSAAEVARRLAIQQNTVYRLRQLGYLPAAHEVQAHGNRRWRWDPETVRDYATRTHRSLAE